MDFSTIKEDKQPQQYCPLKKTSLKGPYVKDNEIMFNTMSPPDKEFAIPHIQTLWDVYSRGWRKWMPSWSYTAPSWSTPATTFTTALGFSLVVGTAFSCKSQQQSSVSHSCLFNKAHANSLTPYMLYYITPNICQLSGLNWCQIHFYNITVETHNYLK